MINTQNNNLNKDALATILLDMQANGITDIISDTAFDFFAKSIVKRQPVKISKTKIINTKPATHKVTIPTNKPITNINKQVTKIDIDLTKHVWQINEDAKIMCIVNGSKNGEKPFNNHEKVLFNNMLKAIGLSDTEVGYLVVADKYCIEENYQQLTKICRRIISASRTQNIISFGESICNILMGGNVSLAGMRGFGKEVAGIRYVATYSPKILLKQPLLKSLAWQDLQILQGYIKVANND